MSIRVMLIEDDPMVQEVNRSFIERIPGFQVCAIASNGSEGLADMAETSPDLILLDNFMPQKNGVETLLSIRQKNLNVDVIVITAAKDKETILTMKRFGAFDYIIKPFQFSRLQEALLNYKNFKQTFKSNGPLEQKDLDLLQGPSPKYAGSKEDLPKGLNQKTLQQVTSFLSIQSSPLSAEETAEGIGIARVTARRYLEYLQQAGQVELVVEYGSIGRPVNRYKWIQ
ncbi:response regulator [Bacillus sp. SCS-153A]|uniref:response regulator n=1 Tax=Rossellomorea sedimentorum TaxID=3115294 RepID=UPI003905760B